MKQVDLRIVSATNRDLRAEIKSGAFREDLYYRLNAIEVLIPALADRPTDIVPLFEYFVGRTGDSRSVSKALSEAIGRHDWPGNVRELENEAKRLVALTPPGEALDPDLLSPRVREGGSGPNAQTRRTSSLMTKEEAERALVLEHLEAANGNKTLAAESLGISREGLRKKLLRLDLK